MRFRTVMAAAISLYFTSCVADDFVAVEPRAPSSARASVDPAPDRTPTGAAAKPTPTEKPAPALTTSKVAPPKLPNPPPATTRAVPEDLEPLFIAASREQPPGERTIELIAVASLRMREASPFSAAIGERLEPYCLDVFFSDRNFAGMERLGLRRHAVRKGESPWKIGRALGVDPAHVARLNPTAEATHLRVGQRLKVLDLASADLEIVIDRAAHRLALYRLPADGGGAQLLMFVPVAHGAAATPTHPGATRVASIVSNPLYVDRKSNSSHGPLDPKNPWGPARISLAPDPLDVERCEIHGRPGHDPAEFAGLAVTDGDLWLRTEDLARLVECLRVGARVVIS